MPPPPDKPDAAPWTAASARTLRLFVLTACAAPMLLLLALAWIDREQLQQETMLRGARTATALADQALRVFEANAAALARIEERARGLDAASLGRSPEFNAFLRSVAAEVRLTENVGVIDPEGRLAAFSAIVPAGSASLTDKDFFLAHVDRGSGIFVGEVMRVGREAEPKFMISRSRAAPSGGFGGVVFSTVAPTALTDLYRSIADAGDSVTLARSDGSVLARYPAAAEGAKRLAPDGGLLEASRNTPAGGFYRTDRELDAVDRLHAFAPVGGYPVYVSYGMSPATLSRRWRSNLIGYGLVSGFSTLLLALVGAAALRSATGERRALQSARSAAEAGARAETELSRARESKARDAARASEVRFRRLVEANILPMAFRSFDGRILEANDAFLAMIGYSRRELEEGRLRWDVLTAPEHRPLDEAAARELRATGKAKPFEKEYIARDGRRVPILIAAALLPDLAGAEPLIATYYIDLTEQRQALVATRRLVDELNHRVKNTLAAVQSIAHQTLRSTRDPVAARQAFEARLLALSAAHDVLTRRNWDSVELPDMLEAVAATHEDLEGRWRAEGPRVKLTPRMALPLSLAFQELFSNARIHGSLSNDSGDVRVVWSVHELPSGGHEIAIEWREKGGPPVGEPGRAGFGMRMLKRSLALELDGSVSVEFGETGFVCRIRAPLRAAPAGGMDVA